MSKTYVPVALWKRTHLEQSSAQKTVLLTKRLSGMDVLIPAYKVTSKELHQISSGIVMYLIENTLELVSNVVAPDGSSVKLWSCIRDAECSFDTRHGASHLQAALMDVATELSLLTHVTMCVYGEVESGIERPYREDVMVFALRHCLLGDVRQVSATELFDVGLMEDLDQGVFFEGPVVGRGVVHADSKGIPCAQTIGGITFVFFSMQHCHEKEKLTIITRSMVQAWNDRVKGKTPASREKEIFSSENAATIVACVETARLEQSEKMLKAAEEIVERKKKRLRDAVRSVDQMRIMAKACKDESLSVLPKREAALRELLADPLVQEVCDVDDGIEISTNEVCIIHADIAYTVGTFVLRFDADCKLTVWAKTQHHPRGVMHPHIGKSSAVCFGNITASLEEKCARYDFATAALMVLRWLVDGYMHESADTPITEWPEAVVVSEESTSAKREVFDAVVA